ncbi:hypothetical protein [Caldilinea sp.]|uniref:hypothetical protein n=1 Tax=Caldilinea sp. TaxID=2293560 RepID=UPI0026266A26|nr:hypothetical protein [uncultured Caldilinea sp.]
MRIKATVNQKRLKGWRSWLVLLWIVSLIFSAAPVAAAPSMQRSTGGQYTIGDCNRVERGQLRNEIEAHVVAVLQNEAKPFDVDGIVSRAWTELQMDAAIDAEVKRAVDALMQSEDYFNRLLSGWWPEKAEEYAERVANDAFGSPTFRAKLDALSAAIGREVAKQVEAQFAQAASVALLCLQAYVGERYSQAFFELFAVRVQQETQALALDPLPASTSAALVDHRLALTGVATIVATQLIHRLSVKLSEKLAQRVAGRIVGRILGRAGSSFIPIAGWVVGIGLIVYDLWEGGQGALPQIQEALQSEEVKQKIRQEIADAVRDDLPEQASMIALETAASLIEQWQGFCDAYAYVCMVAEENADFRRLLQETTLDELEAVANLVNFYMRQLGRAELDRALADGSLSLLLTAPEAALTILSETYNTAETLAWVQLAGDALARVAAWGVHRRARPEEFTSATFAAFISLPKEEMAQKLLALSAEKRSALLKLPQETLIQLLEVQPVADLDWLAGYLLLPDQPQAQEVVTEVVEGRLAVVDLRNPAPLRSPTIVPSSSPSPVTGVADAGEPVVESVSPTTNFGFPSPLLLVGLLLLVAAGAGGAAWRWRRRNP